jgi:hypothetical protein
MENTQKKQGKPASGISEVQLGGSGAQAENFGSAMGQIVRLGKDEMNLAEHPFAALWKNASRESVLYLEWERPHATTKKPIKASWRVTGDPELGLPTATDEQVYLVLMELTREAGFTQTVYFTRHNLVKRLGWADNGRSNQMLRDSFSRLTSVNVTAENSFWNPRAKQFSSATFHILDNTEIFAESPGLKSSDASAPLSYFKWNDILFQSFVHGNIRSLDLTMALALRGSIALRLFRFLDKKTHGGQRPFEIGLRDLCELHLGMAVEECYESNLKAKLKPAHQELVDIGFLRDVHYEPMKTRAGSKVRYLFRAKKPDAATLRAEPAAEISEAPSLPAPAELLSGEHADLMRRMLDLKISRHVAQDLLKDYPIELLQAQLDCLAARVPRDWAATYVKSVREGWCLPGKYLVREKGLERAENAQDEHEVAFALKVAEKAATGQRRASAELEESRLDVLWSELGAEEQENLDKTAHERLGKNYLLG